MSLCAIDLDWADGSYSFCLPLAQLEELQRVCDAGPLAIYNRLSDGSWTHREVYHTLRLGLVGGGMSPPEALRKTRLYVLDRPWLENIQPALAVIQAVLLGKPDEPVGKSSAAGTASNLTASTESSTSVASTDSAP